MNAEKIHGENVYVNLDEIIETVYQCRRKPADDEWVKRWLEPLQSLMKIEVSEDCISKEYLKSFEYINKGDFNSVETIREWIDNAPSVVPTTEQSSMVGERIDSYKAGYEKAMIEVMEAHPNINKVGKWLRKDGRVWSRCSSCGSGSSFETNYCGNCGAAMEGHDVDVTE